MTDTHDGSHTWLKYVSRKEVLADQIIKDFVNEKNDVSDQEAG